MQQAARTGKYDIYQKYAKLINEQDKKHFTLRGLLDFKPQTAISIDEVEPIENILKRFKTGAMSYGSISSEAHEGLAIAMNRIGGKSNTGEGGEDPERYTWTNELGDSKNSGIKQVTSGRFGVTSLYLSQGDGMLPHGITYPTNLGTLFARKPLKTSNPDKQSALRSFSSQLNFRIAIFCPDL